MLGKNRRFSRFLYPSSTRGLLVPIDHGLTVGPLPGIESVRAIQRWVDHPAICGVIAHKGIAERLLEGNTLHRKGLLLHLNGMSALSATADTKERLTTMETALRLGADGVSFQVNFDGKNDAQNIRLMGEMVDDASRFALPVLAMVYDKVPAEEKTSVHRLRHFLRIAIEMGCDAVKIAPPKKTDLLGEILANLSEDIRVFLAGGTLTEEEALADLTRAAIQSGASGLCVGRNVFQREDVAEILENLRRILAPHPLQISELPFAAGSAYGTH